MSPTCRRHVAYMFDDFLIEFTFALNFLFYFPIRGILALLLLAACLVIAFAPYFLPFIGMMWLISLLPSGEAAMRDPVLFIGIDVIGVVYLLVFHLILPIRGLNRSLDETPLNLKSYADQDDVTENREE